jgi:hypothetical protein
MNLCNVYTTHTFITEMDRLLLFVALEKEPFSTIGIIVVLCAIADRTIPLVTWMGTFVYHSWHFVAKTLIIVSMLVALWKLKQVYDLFLGLKEYIGVSAKGSFLEQWWLNRSD